MKNYDAKDAWLVIDGKKIFSKKLCKKWRKKLLKDMVQVRHYLLMKN